MKLTLLGTGTPAPSLTRQSSGYLVEVGEDVIIFDHGPGSAHRLLEIGHSPRDVTHLFLTHLHYDHFADYPRLLLQRWDEGAGKIGELDVFGPPPLARITEKLIGPDGIYGPDLEARVSHRASRDVYAARGGVPPRAKPAPNVREVGVGDIIEGSAWQVKVGSARHFQPYLECLAYRIQSEEGSIVYSGDSGGVFDGMIELAENCDVLIHMCHFLSRTEPSEEFRLTNGSHMDVAEVARRAGARTLVLTHIVPGLDEPGVIERMVAEMAGVYEGTIIVGRDLLTVPLSTTYPARIELGGKP